MREELEKIIKSVCDYGYDSVEGSCNSGISAGGEFMNENDATEAIMKLVESKIPKRPVTIDTPILQGFDDCIDEILTNLGIEE